MNGLYLVVRFITYDSTSVVFMNPRIFAYSAASLSQESIVMSISAYT